MKKFILLSLVLGSLFLFSYNDYGNCAGTTEHKALTCGACHGGSISNEVFIIDGKTEEIEENVYEYVVKIPASTLSSLQLSTRVLGLVSINPTVQVDLASEMAVEKGQTLFSLVNLNEKTTKVNGKDELYTRFRFAFNEALSEPTTVAIEGVLSNQDGTVNGDQSFYKELVLEPAKLVDSKLDAYYFDHRLVLGNLYSDLLRIIDLQGKVVYSEYIEESTRQVNLKDLNEGIHYAIMGTHNKEQESLSFYVK